MGAMDSELQAQMFNLCTRDGTPEQARHAVYTMAALLNPSKDATPGSKEPKILTWDEQHDTFGSLLKSLTSSSRMTLGAGCGNFKIISILTALAALAECAPTLFCKDGHNIGKGGDKAIKFALEACLLGRGSSMDNQESEGSGEDMSEDEPVDKTPNSIKSKRQQSRKSGASFKHMTPDGTKSAVEDETLSLVCRRLCAAIEFLVSYIRHAGKSDSKTQLTASKAPAERVEQVFGILCQIIEDGGLPPTTRDRRDCKGRQDRAALRKCAAIHLLRLCDSRIKLETTYLTHARWHILAGSLLDEEKSVRDGIMEELSMMFTGKGAYRPSGSTFAPGLRFLAMVTLCTDMDHGATHSGANGNAANLGKRSLSMKTAAMHCIIGLRRTCDATLAQSRALGAAVEHRFETSTKMRIMPEYAVPFALHLLSFRRETPSAGGGTGSGMTQPSSTQSGEDEQFAIDEENRHKMLRKRLKWLFEPLVQSLGEGADNISFLLRMVDFLGNHYQPKDVSAGVQDVASPMSPNSILSPAENVDQRAEAALRSAALSAAKLKVICVASREVLLSFVKKDINLTPYPGGIQLPSSLFRRAQGTENVPLSQQSGGTSERSLLDSSVSSPRTVERRRKAATDGGVKSSGQKDKDSHRGLSPSSTSANRDSLDSRESMCNTDSPRRKSRVHFSPELEQRRSLRSSQGSDGTGDVSFGGISPIVKPHSPREDRSVVSEVKTLGTTPPSILRTAPEDDASTDVELPLSLDCSKSASSSVSRRSTRRSAQSIMETPEIIQHSAETMTTSETPLSDDQDDYYGESHSPGEKRKLTSREESIRRRKKSKKESLRPAAKIELNRTDDTHAKKKSKKSRSATPISSCIGDEFSFSDDENVENGRKVSKKPVSSLLVEKKKKKTFAKGRGAATKRTGRSHLS